MVGLADGMQPFPGRWRPAPAVDEPALVALFGAPTARAQGLVGAGLSLEGALRVLVLDLERR